MVKGWIIEKGRLDAPGFLRLSLNCLGQLLHQRGFKGLKALKVARQVQNDELWLVEAWGRNGQKEYFLQL